MFKALNKLQNEIAHPSFNLTEIEEPLDLTDEETLSDFQKDIELGTEMCLAIEAQNALQLRAGNESLTGYVVNSIASVGDFMGHIVNLFSTALFHGWRDFKRSELQDYLDSNVVSYRAMMMESNYIYFANEVIYYPQGMKGNYIKALEALHLYFKHVDILSRTKKIEAMLQAILKDLNSSTVNNFTSHVRDINQILVERNVLTHYNNVMKIFSDGKEDTARFKEHFGSVKDFKNTIDSCLEFESNMRSVAAVYDNLKNIEIVVGKIIEKAGELNGPQTTDLSKAVRAVAQLFEQYAIVMNNISRVNHNLTLNVVNMNKRAKETN